MGRIGRFAVLGVMTALVLGGCTQKPKVEQDRPVGTLYNEAAAALDQGDYRKASEKFDAVDQQHPYSKWATQAELMSAYAHYKAGEYEEAVLGLDNFVQLHPGSKNVDYALYLKALCYYEQITDVARDQSMTQKALDALNALIRRYPDSRYAQDATLKRDLTRDHLAGKEMEIGRYYLHRDQINAAVNRFLDVVKNYQTTTHVPEALERLVECYMTLDLKDQATKVASVLGYNYPGSKWYARAYKLLNDKQRAEMIAHRSLFDRTVDSLFKPD